MFIPFDKSIRKPVKIYFEGKPFNVPEGISVAAAVLGHAHAHHTSINSVTGEHRAPFCLMGVCFECMVEINGQPNQQACLITVEEGMDIKRQTELVGCV
jgi:predicted molibdopterin-dependent oxidoreductase YjgC